jgi:hypothetical protein
MEITRNEDASLTLPVVPGRHDAENMEDGSEAAEVPTTRTLHPGQPGYVEALAEWDEQHNGGRETATSTSTGREEAMSIVHAVAVDPAHDVHRAVETLSDPEPSAEALRHVLVGGDPSVKGFAEEVAQAEGDEPIPTHKVTKIISEVLAEIDT